MLARPATQQDIPYVLDSFGHEYSRSPYAGNLARSQVRQLLVTLLQKSDWNCTILCEPDVPEEILAYVVWRSPQEIAWLQRKSLYRDHRLAAELLRQIGTDLTRAVTVTFAPSARFLKQARHAGYHLVHHPYQGLV